MFRLWGKIIKNNKIIKDIVIENSNSKLTDSQKLDVSIQEICYMFDLSKPLWLTNNEKEMPLYNKTSFRADHFIDPIDFDYLEIEIIE